MNDDLCCKAEKKFSTILRINITGRVAGLTHEGTAFVFLCGRCQSCGVRSPSCSVSVASCARCQSRCAQSPRREESRVIASSVVSRRLSPRREESRVIASSVGVSRVVCGVVSVSVASRRASSRCSASVGLCARRVSRVPFSFSDSMDDVFFRPVLTRRVFFLF